MKKLLLFLLLFVSVVVNAQKGISYQAVILAPEKIEIPGQDISGQPFINGYVLVKFVILSGTISQFEEVHQTKTDAYGLVNLIIGSVASTTFNALNWNGNQKSLQVFVSFDNGASYTKVSDQKLTYIPYAFFSETAGKLDGVVEIANGGTGATTAQAARLNLGLGDVDNTSDAAKPISTATQAALDLKANILDIKTLATNATLSDLNTFAPKNSPTFSGTVSGITKSMVGLANVDNTSDANKPISTAMLTELNLKLNSNGNAASATKLATARSVNGVAFDGTQDINIAAAAAAEQLTGTTLNSTVTGSSLTSVGTLTNLTVTNPIIGSVTGNAATVTTNANLTGPITSLGNTTSIASQTGSGTTFVMNTSPTLITPNLGVASATSINKVSVTAPTTGSTLTIADGKTLTVNNSLALVGTDGTTMTFPTSSATIARTDADQTFTGVQTFLNPSITTPSGIVKADVGLGNVDDTSDADKPVSTLQQAALDLKAPLASPSLTGTPLAPTATVETNTTQIATTEFVTRANATNANLTGEVTSFGNTTTVLNEAVINKVLTGYTSGAGTVAATDNIRQAIQKLNGNAEEMSAFDIVVNSTGIVYGGILSIGSPNTTFSISDGTGIIVDNSVTPATITRVSWTGKTNITASYITNGLISNVAIDRSGNVFQQEAPFSNVQNSQYIVIGSLVHVNQINLDAISQFGQSANSPVNQLTELSKGLGRFNISGNVFSAHGTDLKINKSVGTVYSTGSNLANNLSSPNTVTLAALPALVFQYRFKTGTNGVTGTEIDPNIYDLNGASSTVPPNMYTIQRIYSFVTNNIKIQPGQNLYASLSNAASAINSEAFVTEPSIQANGILRGYLIIKQGTTNLQNPADAVFLEAAKFSGLSGTGTTSVLTTLQNTYENSTDPEIVTNATRGALSIKRGSGADTDNILEGLNGAGTTTFTLKGNGALATSGNITGANLSGTNTGDQINITGNAATVTTNANLTGPITSLGNTTSIASQTGSGTTFVMNTSPTLVTPNLGTPSAVILANATNLPLTTGVTGLLPIANGGTNNSILPVTPGGVVYTDGAKLVNSGAGLSGDILKSQGAGTPVWLTPGTANGVASLDANGKIPSGQLPAGVQVYKGTWNASTNTPTLSNGTGSSGDTYQISVSGSQDLGSGSISFVIHDELIYNGTIWEKIAGVAAEYVDLSNAQTVSGAKTWSNLGTFNGGIMSTGAAVNLNNDATANAVNIGTSLNTGTVTIGGTGTQILAIGNGAGIKTTQLGSNTSTSSTTLFSGTTAGVLAINASAGAAVTNIGTGTTTGAITIGNSSNTITLPKLSTSGIVTNSATGLLATVAVLPIANGGTGNTTGVATTNANLTGEVTSVGNVATVPNATVINKVLTGYIKGAGTVVETDNLLQAIQKLDGNNLTNANLTGPITSVGNTTSIASQTGIGSKFVMDTSPTLIAPNLGTPASGIATNLSGTAPLLTAGNVTTNANLTGAVVSNGNATILGSFTSAGLSGALTNETGTGAAVFATNPTLVTPNLGIASATSINKVSVTAPATGSTLTIADGSSFITAGAFATTLTSTGPTNVTLPTIGTLATTGTLVKVTSLTAGTTFTKQASTNMLVVYVVGAGGGGGGVVAITGNGFSGAAGGGGGGEVRIVRVTAPSASAYTIALGAGGTAGANTGGTGGTGGTSTWDVNALSATITAIGGSGGGGTTSATTTTTGAGGAGGTGGTGTADATFTGFSGTAGGAGGSPFGGFGSGAASSFLATTGSVAGKNGQGFGAGGSGAASLATAATDATANIGGVGAGGMIIVYEYK